LLQVHCEGHGEGQRCTVLAVLAAAALPRLEHLAKNNGTLSLLVFGDWGRKGECNQSQVAK
jgi:tartrate-resistant acid phosphatase type 5